MWGGEDTSRVVIRQLASVVGHAADAAHALVGGRRRAAPDEGNYSPVAQQSTVTFVDDLDDTVPAEETVTFTLDGTSYEIDLSVEHAATMREDLATWVTHARRTSSGGRTRRSPIRSAGRKTAPTPRTGGRTPADRAQAGAVRDWARSNGYTVSGRGHIPAAVQDAFDAASTPA